MKELDSHSLLNFIVTRNERKSANTRSYKRVERPYLKELWERETSDQVEARNKKALVVKCQKS